MSLDKVHSILNILQEGMFKSFKMHNGDLNFNIECSFLANQMNKNHSGFYGVFKNCEDIYFKSWDEDILIIDNLNEIKSLKLFILNTEVEENGYLKIYCNCSNTYIGGNLFIHSKNLLLFNEDLEIITLDALTEISKNYWYQVEGSENHK